jgi:hypothetical protein
MVVTEIQMSKSMDFQNVETFWFPTEDIPLEHRFLDLRCWTFQISHDEVAMTQQGVDTP